MAEIKLPAKRQGLEIALLKVNGVLFMWVACAESALGSIRPSEAVGTTGVVKDYDEYLSDRINRSDV